MFPLPFIVVDAGDNLVMADDVATPSNPPVATIDKEKLEEVTFDETPLDEIALELNVSQWLRKKNRPGEWCAFKLIVQHGIVDCFLTHML